jgi:hypothetical protein
MTWVTAALGGSLAIAAVSTLGDFIWATWIPRHRAIYGMSHGTLLFLAIGLYLGVLARQPAAGIAAGAVVGFVAAGSFYLLAPVAGYSIMFAVWIGAWLALSVLHGWLQRTLAGLRPVLIRGVIASIACGAAFYAVSGIWFPFRPSGWDYLWHFGAWTVAYLPGFAALFVANSSRPLPMHPAGGVRQ